MARLHLVGSERRVESLTRIGHDAQTLHRLVSDLAEQAADGLDAAGPEARRLLAERVAREPSLVDLIDRGVGALRAAGITSSELRRLGGARAELLASAMTEIDSGLEAARLRDERADAWLALRAVKAETLASVDELWVDGWLRLDAGELALLEALHRVLVRRGGGVVLRFPGLTGDHSARAVESAQAALERLWSEHNDAPSIVREDERHLAGLKLEIVRTPNAESEARVAVHAVLEARARGARIDRIAIVPLDLSESFLEELRSALARAGLPFSEPRGRPPLSGPNVHAALELLRLSAGPIRRGPLLDLLAAPGLRLGRWFGEDGARGRARLRGALARVPVLVDPTGDTLLERVAALESAASDPTSEVAAADALARILEDLRKLTRGATRATAWANVSELLRELGLGQPTSGALARAITTRDQGDPALLTALSDDARGAEALSRAFERLVEAAARLGLAEQMVSAQTLLAELERALERPTPVRGSARAAALSIAKASDIAGVELDLLVVCRASSACFGRGEGVSPALGTELSEALPKGRRPPSARDEETATLVALNSLLASSTESRIVWSSADGSSETAESRVVLGLRSAGHVERSEPGSGLAPGARRFAALPPSSGEVRARADTELGRQAFYLEQRAPDPFNGRVHSLSRWVGPGQAPLPITRLERYGDCAFLGFAAIVLKASRDETIQEGLGARERGTIIHAAVAEALIAIRGQRQRPVDESMELALDAARLSLDRHRGLALRGAALESALADVKSWVRWSLGNDDFAFAEAERGFGEGQEWPALELGPYRLSGRLDRYDLAAGEKSARVIDYKSGSPPSKGPHALQGHLYARKLALELGVTSVQSLYLSISRRVAKASPIFVGDVNSADLQEKERQALDLLQRLESGDVRAEPSRPSRCARCDTRDLCRRPLSAPVGADAEDEADSP